MNRLRSWAPGVVPLTIGLVALWYFHGIVAAQDALSTWIVGRYLGVMLLAGLWGLSALCGGFFVSEKLKLGALPLRERLVFSFALGLLTWALLIVAMGLLGVLGKAMFFAMPLFFFGVGGLPPLLKTLSRASRLRSQVRAKPARVLDAREEEAPSAEAERCRSRAETQRTGLRLHTLNPLRSNSIVKLPSSAAGRPG